MNQQLSGDCGCWEKAERELHKKISGVMDMFIITVVVIFSWVDLCTCVTYVFVVQLANHLSY